jgi:hypothetical protein
MFLSIKLNNKMEIDEWENLGGIKTLGKENISEQYDIVLP